MRFQLLASDSKRALIFFSQHNRNDALSGTLLCSCEKDASAIVVDGKVTKVIDIGVEEIELWHKD
jgi:hypothetical protein